MSRLFFLALAFNIIVGTSVFYVGASAITSAVKAGSDSCGKTYPIEAVLGGDWFCEEVEDGAIPR